MISRGVLPRQQTLSKRTVCENAHLHASQIKIKKEDEEKQKREEKDDIKKEYALRRETKQ